MLLSKSTYRSVAVTLPCLLFFACSEGYFKNDYKDNSPTSGQLKVFYDEGLELHVKNQTATFESQYQKAFIYLRQSSEDAAVQALYNDSCEAIVISRMLNEKEKKAFASKEFYPKYTAVAKSGVAVICNIETPVNYLSLDQFREILSRSATVKDSTGKDLELKVLFDKNNSSVLHYVLDSILEQKKLSANCSILNSTLESINYVAKNKNTLAIIDFAWLSDVDDSISVANRGKIKFIALSKKEGGTYEYPSQSSFKLGTYPMTRNIYVYRKTGDFTLAKGFESYIAGPKGQLTFLKQGLLPTHQTERNIEVNIESQSDKSQ